MKAQSAPRKVPVATAAEVERLRSLDAQWQKWSRQRDRYSFASSILDQQRARANFIADPSPENERALLECADPRLNTVRYQAVTDACNAALGRLAYELRDIMVPILERKLRALEKNLAAALEEEARLSAAERDRGFIFARTVNGPVGSVQQAITQTRDAVRDLNELGIDRSPAIWLEHHC